MTQEPGIDKNEGTLKIQVPIISILGGPGSGKGTQCENLVKKYKFTHISTGDLMRDEVSRNTSLGRTAAQFIKRGGLVESSIVLKVLKTKFEKELATSRGFLLDGFPRSIEQAKCFEQSVAPITAYMYLNVSDEVMLKRLVDRGKQGNRIDDNEETAKNRIKVFHQQTQPIVGAFQSKIETIDAEGSVTEVCLALDAVFSKHISKDGIGKSSNN